MKRFVLAVSGILLAADALAQGAVFRGPYLQNVTSDAITISWESPTPTSGIVRYGLGAPSEQLVASGAAARHQSVRLSGLSGLAPSGARFVYELEVDGVRRAGSFRTAATGAQPFTFLVYGDNRSSRPQHEAVVEALMSEAEEIRFAINTGDLVSDGETESDWDQFFEVEAPFLARTPMFVAIGNHEVSGTSTWDVTRRIVEHPTTVPPASSDEAFYHFVYGNVEIIVVNVEVDHLYTFSLLAGAQEEWLESVLGARPAGVDHRFLFLHQGPYSSKPGRNGNFWLRQWLDQLTPEIDMIFSGHDHYAELGFARTGIPYVVHGGGGAPLYDTLGVRVTSDHTIIYGESRLGYVLVDVDGPSVRVTIKGIDGSTVASHAYGESPPECVAPVDCGPPLPTSCPEGAWECHRGACRFSCPESGSLIMCLNDDACVRSIGSFCAGTPTCERPGLDPRQWYCQCNVPPDCQADGDCAGRPPPVAGCVGTWSCQSEACEFSPTRTCEEPRDAGLQRDASSDASVSLDGSVVDARAGLDAFAGVDASPVADALADAAPIEDAPTAAISDAGASDTRGPAPADSSCGCRAHARSSVDGAVSFAAFLFGCATLRARRLKRRPLQE
ncbi:MAG: metallophosphoesterase [Deltaproteobacteria bacterium]|nr:metallophosphoesterase [Deltaproteobacteria bacterium]